MPIHAYRCTCVAGFANGVCEYDFIAEYSAECSVQDSSGGLGGNCDIDVDECASGMCVNNATCEDSNDDLSIIPHLYLCTCVDGYEHSILSNTEWGTEGYTNSDNNQDCGVNIDECASSPCQNGATCTDAVLRCAQEVRRNT